MTNTDGNEKGGMPYGEEFWVEKNSCEGQKQTISRTRQDQILALT